LLVAIELREEAIRRSQQVLVPRHRVEPGQRGARVQRGAPTDRDPEAPRTPPAASWLPGSWVQVRT